MCQRFAPVRQLLVYYVFGDLREVSLFSGFPCSVSAVRVRHYLLCRVGQIGLNSPSAQSDVVSINLLMSCIREFRVEPTER